MCKKIHTPLEAAFLQASMLSANMSGSPRKLCLHDGANCKKELRSKDSLAIAIRLLKDGCVTIVSLTQVLV